MDYERELKIKSLYFEILNLWMYETLQGNSIIPYLNTKGFNRIIIYGMAALGDRLFQELKANGVDVVCVIDRNPYIIGDFDLTPPACDIPDADLIIVTAEYYYDEIKTSLLNRASCPIMSMTQLFTAAFNCRF